MGLRTEDWKGGKEEMKKWDNQAVWKMVMGDDTDEGKGGSFGGMKCFKVDPVFA